MKRFFSLVVMLLGLLVCNANATNVLQGLVVGVSDGDSLTLLDAEKRQHKIRLQGIDAPEMKQPMAKSPKNRCRSWSSTKPSRSIGPRKTDLAGRSAK
jgi:endonuclease YncB( thermonuclease family)